MDFMRQELAIITKIWFIIPATVVLISYIICWFSIYFLSYRKKILSIALFTLSQILLFGVYLIYVNPPVKVSVIGRKPVLECHLSSMLWTSAEIPFLIVLALPWLVYVVLFLKSNKQKG
jgi:hypothetical protein